MDMLAELFIEIFFEVYMELMLLIIPAGKRSKKHTVIAAIIAIAALIGVISLVIWGVALISDHDNLIGIVPITLAAVVSLAQITAGIVLYVKNR